MLLSYKILDKTEKFCDKIHIRVNFNVLMTLNGQPYPAQKLANRETCENVLLNRPQRAPASCISTYVKSTRTAQRMLHHWVEGNTAAKCSKCRKQIKSYNGITGLHCRWCHLTVNKTIKTIPGANHTTLKVKRQRCSRLERCSK
jgi:hypothetical protein